YGWSGTSVATGSTPVTTEFVLPTSLPLGSYNLVVVANGFASDPLPFGTYQTFCLGDGSSASCPCFNFGLPGHGCETSGPTGGSLLTGTGYASLVADTVHLTSTGEMTAALSVLLQGSTTISAVPYGDGLRCTGGILKRLFSHNAS